MLYHVAKLVKIDRFNQITIGMVPVGFRHVFFGLRGSEHDNRNVKQFLTRLDLTENFQAVYFGKTQVEQNEVRAGAALKVLVFVSAKQIIQGRLTVLDQVDLLGYPIPNQTPANQFCVIRVVFHVKNRQRLVCHLHILSTPVNLLLGNR